MPYSGGRWARATEPSAKWQMQRLQWLSDDASFPPELCLCGVFDFQPSPNRPRQLSLPDIRPSHIGELAGSRLQGGIARKRTPPQRTIPLSWGNAAAVVMFLDRQHRAAYIARHHDSDSGIEASSPLCHPDAGALIVVVPVPPDPHPRHVFCTDKLSSLGPGPIVS